MPASKYRMKQIMLHVHAVEKEEFNQSKTIIKINLYTKSSKISIPYVRNV